jgi:hypothetical protein
MIHEAPDYSRRQVLLKFHRRTGCALCWLVLLIVAYANYCVPNGGPKRIVGIKFRFDARICERAAPSRFAGKGVPAGCGECNTKSNGEIKA